MPTLNNYTFSDVTYVITEGDNVPGEIGTALLTISPASGYAIDVADFSLDPSFSDPNVDNVAFAQNGDNIDVTITFVSGFVMPSNNVSINLCIIGQGTLNKISISGYLSATVGTNITGNSSETNTVYTNDGAFGESELLFSRTYTADTNYILATTPTCSVTSGNQSNYNIVQTPTYNIDNQLTSITFDVNYIYPNQDVEFDHITINVPSARAIYQPTPRISGYFFDRSALGNSEETRTLTVVGIPGTTFGATLNDGVTTTTIISNEDLDSNGQYEYDITFPELTKGDPNVTYTIELTGAYVSTIEQANPFTIDQLNEVIIKVDVTNPPTPIAGWPSFEPRVTYKALSQSPFTDPANSLGIWILEIDEEITPFSGTGAFTVDKQVELSDFAETTIISAGIDGDQTSTTTLILDDTTGILPGDRFNNNINQSDNENAILAPFTYEVISVDSPTQLTISPSITVQDNTGLVFTRSNGNVINLIDSDVTLVDPSTVNLKFTVAIINYGDANITFDLDLSNIISYIL
jgi:hypothetical protein